MPEPSSLSLTSDLIDYINRSPSPYHAVSETRRRLLDAGFSQLDERESWNLKPGGRAFVIRAGGTIAAFITGTLGPEESGVLMIGAHTDSPNLRVKPLPDIKNHGYVQVGVETYGGLLRSTWMDRDLSIAGRVATSKGAIHLVRFDSPLCRISNVAIHLNRTVNTDGLKLNPQKHLIPTLGLDHEDEDGLRGLLARRLNEEGINAEADTLTGLELCLYDTQAGTLGGADNEFINTARLDNLASCHAALTALLDSGEATEHTRMIVLYDHEEVGSQSQAGAKGRFVLHLLERIAHVYGDGTPENQARTAARSLLVSADMAHAVHPNYSDNHAQQPLPKMGQGPVIKLNVNQSYATDAVGTAFFEKACQTCGFSAQRFVSRNDMGCGSTIGPISAARIGIRTVDVGNPMLSMHSCRETAGTGDVAKMIAVMTHILRAGNVPPPEA